MKDFDKIFSEKLYDHKTPPPADLWGAMDEALDHEQNKKKKIIFWRVAAAIALLLVAGTPFWVNQDTVSPFQLSEENASSVESVQPIAPRQQDVLALEESEVSREMEERGSKQTESVSESPATFAEQYTQTKAAAVEETNTMEELTPEPKRALPPELEKINPTQPTLAELSSDQPATLAVLPQNPDRVTIIYSPGEPLQKADKGKPLEVLADIKNTGISFAEIRSAKSELLAKVFNKLDQDIIR